MRSPRRSASPRREPPRLSEALPTTPVNHVETTATQTGATVLGEADFTYNSNGLMTTHTDANGHKTTLAYCNHEGTHNVGVQGSRPLSRNPARVQKLRSVNDEMTWVRLLSRDRQTASTSGKPLLLPTRFASPPPRLTRARRSSAPI